MVLSSGLRRPTKLKQKLDSGKKIGQYSCPIITAKEKGSGSTSMNVGTDRETRDVSILGSAPSEAPTIDAPPTAVCQGLDLGTYVKDLGDDVPEEHALEFLFALTSMMASCVRNGWDVGVCAQVLTALNEASTVIPDAVESKIQPATKAKSDLHERAE